MTVRKIQRLRARPLIAVLAALGRAGTRLPSVGVGGYRVSLDSSTGRLYARSRTAYLGTVRGSGVYKPSLEATRDDVAAIGALVERTLDVARGAAILLGLKARCAVCGRLLNSKDRLRGIGDGCYISGEFWRLEKGTSVGGKRSVTIGRRGRPRNSTTSGD